MLSTPNCKCLFVTHEFMHQGSLCPIACSSCFSQISFVLVSCHSHTNQKLKWLQLVGIQVLKHTSSPLSSLKRFWFLNVDSLAHLSQMASSSFENSSLVGSEDMFKLCPRAMIAMLLAVKDRGWLEAVGMFVPADRCLGKHWFLPYSVLYVWYGTVP